MSEQLDHGLLTQRQVELLQDLATAVVASEESPSRELKSQQADAGAGSAEYEAFYCYCRRVTAQQRREVEAQSRSHWGWIERLGDLCESACCEFDSLLVELETLARQQQVAARKMAVLCEQSESRIRDGEQLSGKADAIEERLGTFDRVAGATRALDQGTLPSPTDIGTVLDELEKSAEYLEAHYDFSGAQAHLQELAHQRHRACLMVRGAVQRSLEQSATQVENEVWLQSDDGAVQTQVFYHAFNAGAQSCKQLSELLQQRVQRHKEYATALEDLEVYYVDLRARLVAEPLGAHIRAVIGQSRNLSAGLRQVASYILEVSGLEIQCFDAHFKKRQPQEALPGLLWRLGDSFQQAVHSAVLACTSLDALREAAEHLHAEFLEPRMHCSTPDALTIPYAAVTRLHEVILERLVFQARAHIKKSISAFTPMDQDLDYPACLLPAAALGVQHAEKHVPRGSTVYHRGWFPTVDLTLGVLAKTYRALEAPIFEGLASEAIAACVGSLKQASEELASRALPDPTHPLAAAVQVMDARLFLIKQLLILREQVASFECDAATGRRQPASASGSSLLRRSPLLKPLEALILSHQAPKQREQKLGASRTERNAVIEFELRAACEALCVDLVARITLPLAVISAAPLDRLKEAVESFCTKLQTWVPLAAALMRVYLTAVTGSVPAGNAAANSNEGGSAEHIVAILFKPVQKHLLEKWRHWLEEGGAPRQEAAAALDMRGESEVVELISSLLGRAMAASWTQLAGTALQVPRSKPRLDSSHGQLQVKSNSSGFIPSSEEPARSAGKDAAMMDPTILDR